MTNRPLLAHYGPPVPPPSRTRETVGKVMSMVTAVAGTPVSAGLAFWGLVVHSDCFISCGGNPQPLLGSLLIGAALVLLLAPAVLAAALVRRWQWVVGALAVQALEVLAVLATWW